MKCDEHSTYKFSSKCPATCENKNPTDEDCDLPAVEGCVCDDGYYLDDKKCVLESQCGCIADDNEYYKVVLFASLTNISYSADGNVIHECKKGK